MRLTVDKFKQQAAELGDAVAKKGCIDAAFAGDLHTQAYGIGQHDGAGIGQFQPAHGGVECGKQLVGCIDTCLCQCIEQR